MKNVGNFMEHEIFVSGAKDIIIVNDSLEALEDAINKTPVIDGDMVSKADVLLLIDRVLLNERNEPGLTAQVVGFISEIKHGVMKL